MLKQLRLKRSQLVTQHRTVAQNAATRDLTPEEQTQITDLQSQVAALDSRIATLEAIEDGEAADDGAMDDEGGERSLGRKGSQIEGRDLPNLDGKHKYSILKAIRHIGGGRLDGIEAEVHQELAKRSGGSKGVRIPWNLATHRDLGGGGSVRDRRNRTGRERRDLTTTTGAGSIAAILGTDLIDILRARMLTQNLGALVLSDMVGGSFAIPKKSATTSAYWVTEGTAPTVSNAQIGQVVFNPKTCGAYTDLSRKFILQTSLTAEAFARQDLMDTMAVEMDRVGFNGTGSGAQPTGVAQRTGVPTVLLGTNGADPTFAALVAMETAIAVSNADVDNMAYVTTAAARGKLKSTLKASNTAGKMLWEDNQLNGYDAYATNQLPSNLTKGSSGAVCSAALFGNWGDLAFAMWGALDLIEDPYTKSNVGGLRIVLLQDLDVETRRDESFAKIVDMTTV